MSKVEEKGWSGKQEWLRKWSNRYTCGVLMILFMMLGVWVFLKIFAFGVGLIKPVSLWLAVFMIGLATFIGLYLLFLVSVFGFAQDSKYIKRECPNCHARIRKVKEYRWDGRDSKGKDMWVRMKDETW